MKTKRLLCPKRLRRVPHQFSWIDQRLVRDGHISRCGGPHALALYLLLVTVGDSQGLSYYSDKTAARLLGLSQAELRQARSHLLGAGLIAYQDPLYQVYHWSQPWTGNQQLREAARRYPLAPSCVKSWNPETEPNCDLLRALLSNPPLASGAGSKLRSNRSGTTS